MTDIFSRIARRTLGEAAAVKPLIRSRFVEPEVPAALDEQAASPGSLLRPESREHAVPDSEGPDSSRGPDGQSLPDRSVFPDIPAQPGKNSITPELHLEKPDTRDTEAATRQARPPVETDIHRPGVKKPIVVPQRVVIPDRAMSDPESHSPTSVKVIHPEPPPEPGAFQPPPVLVPDMPDWARLEAEDVRAGVGNIGDDEGRQQAAGPHFIRPAARPRPLEAESGLPPGEPVPRRERAAPSVRVTIGRIEVRAVRPPDPPAPARPAQPEMPTLSLDDYLKQRNETDS